MNKIARKNSSNRDTYANATSQLLRQINGATRKMSPEKQILCFSGSSYRNGADYLARRTLTDFAKSLLARLAG